MQVFLRWQENNPALWSLLYFVCHAMNDVTHSTAGDTKSSASNSMALHWKTTVAG